MLKVQIEKSSMDVGLMLELQLFIGAALSSTTLDSFMDKAGLLTLTYNPNKLKFGKGGSHCWVSSPCGQRYLLITY